MRSRPTNGPHSHKDDARTEIGTSFSPTIAGDGGGRRRHRAGRKHQTLAYQARTAREAAAKAIEAAEVASERARAAEAHATSANRRQGGLRHQPAEDSPSASASRSSHLPEPPAVPGHSGDGHGERHAPGDGRNTRRVLDYDAEEQAAKETGRLASISRKVMGLLRYGNIGKGKQKIDVPPLGWRRSSEIGELLRTTTSDVLRATRTSIDWRGEPRFEYGDIHETDPLVRPCHNTASRERR